MKINKLFWMILFALMTAFVINYTYYIAPLNEMIDQLLAQQKIIQAKLLMQTSMQNRQHEILVPHVINWNDRLQQFADMSGLTFDSLRSQPVIVQGVNVIRVTLAMHASPNAIFNFMMLLVSSELPIMLTGMKINTEPKHALNAALSLMILNQFMMRSIKTDQIRQTNIFCNFPPQQFTSTTIPLHAFAMRGYVAQAERQQALLSTGFHLSTFVKVNDIVGEEGAIVKQITPSAVRLALPDNTSVFLLAPLKS